MGVATFPGRAVTKLAELPYWRDSARRFGWIADRPWSLFLDSGYPAIGSGRYDVFACDPYLKLTTFDRRTCIEDAGGRRWSEEDPFMLLRQALGEPVTNSDGLPFNGGAMGYFAYDLGRFTEPWQTQLSRDLAVPDMAVGLYDWAVVADHHQRRCWLVRQDRDPETAGKWRALRGLFARGDAELPRLPAGGGTVRANMDRGHYARAFRRVQEYIHSGDCYQVNLALRFRTGAPAEPWPCYLALRRVNPAPFAAFMRVPGAAVLSSSPERFLHLEGDRVETCPVKGTRPRSAAGYEDLTLAQQLLDSSKDRAENLMIVDLLRNDLGKTCRPGSIAVPRLFALESFATVHHLVSTVTGRLAPDLHALDLLRGCFPGGSITGAPKLRAMQIIDELECNRRSVYCGSIAYLGFNGVMDSNIAIRTAVHDGASLYYWSGGGVVSDSTLEGEYAEIYDKANAFLGFLHSAELHCVGG